MQIVYCQQRKHWVVVSNIACRKNEIQIFDSVFTSTDAETHKIIVNLFQTTKNPKLTCAKIQRQIGANDCGLFAIAVATSIAFCLNPVGVHFRQREKRHHLLDCFEKGQMTPFPTVS